MNVTTSKQSLQYKHETEEHSTRKQWRKYSLWLFFWSINNQWQKSLPKSEKFTNHRVPFLLKSISNYKCSLTRDFMAATLIVGKGKPKCLKKLFGKDILWMIVEVATVTTQKKMDSSFKNFVSKCDQMRGFLWDFQDPLKCHR